MRVIYADTDAMGIVHHTSYIRWFEIGRVELVQIDTDIKYLKRASMKFIYLIWNETRTKVLTEGYSIHACTDNIGKIIRIPRMIADKIHLYYKTI
jgi:acyl-CoA thioester hydrolase